MNCCRLTRELEEVGKAVVEDEAVGIQTTTDKETDPTNEFMFADGKGCVLTN